MKGEAFLTAYQLSKLLARWSWKWEVGATTSECACTAGSVVWSEIRREIAKVLGSGHLVIMQD